MCACVCVCVCVYVCVYVCVRVRATVVDLTDSDLQREMPLITRRRGVLAKQGAARVGRVAGVCAPWLDYRNRHNLRVHVT